jgi:hypothetical protein
VTYDVSELQRRTRAAIDKKNRYNAATVIAGLPAKIEAAVNSGYFSVVALDSEYCDSFDTIAPIVEEWIMENGLSFNRKTYNGHQRELRITWVS